MELSRPYAIGYRRLGGGLAEGEGGWCGEDTLAREGSIRQGSGCEYRGWSS